MKQKTIAETLPVIEKISYNITKYKQWAQLTVLLDEANQVNDWDQVIGTVDETSLEKLADTFRDYADSYAEEAKRLAALL